MKLLTKIKNKIIHLCGGYTYEELPYNKFYNVVHTEYPVEHLKFNYKYFLGTPKERIDQEMAESFANAILQNKLYTSTTINSMETPELLNTTYSIYIARPQKEN